MAIRTITSANAVFMLSIAGLVTAPTQLQGFGVDDAFSLTEVDHAELKLGVDAQVGAGWVPALVPMKINFLASSTSIDLFENWARTQNTNQSPLIAQGTLILSSVQKTYTLINGYLRGYMPAPNAKKVFEDRSFTVTWSDVQPAPYQSVAA